MDAVTRFWSKVDCAGSCWEWQAGKTSLGYGQFHIAGNKVYAHRFAYELVIGPIPTGLEVDHLCRNPGCVNPQHLEAVTHRENLRRGPGRHATCHLGHPFDEANTYYPKRGGRRCRKCHAANEVRRKRLKRA